MPDSLLSRFDLVYVVRDLTDEAIDRKIATQVLSQCRQKESGDGRRRGVEQIHSSIVQRREQTDQRTSQEATEIFEKCGDMRMRFQSGFTDTRDPSAPQKPRLAVTTR